MKEQQFSTLLREEWERIPVGAPPVEAVVGRATVATRRRRAWGGVAIGAAAAAVLAAVLVVTRPEPTDPRPVGPIVDNPVDVAWSDFLTVHLAHTELQLGDDMDDWAGAPSRVAEPGGRYGVVYVDGLGNVHLVDSRGRSALLGRTPENARVVAGSTTTPWAAWVEAGGAAPEVIVHDTATGDEVAREPLPDDAVASDGTLPVVVAVDGDRVWVQTAAGDLVWEPGRDLRPTPYVGSVVLDAAAGTVVTTASDPGATRPTISFGIDGDLATTVEGRGAVVSPDGRHVLVDHADGLERTDDWRLHDAETGAELPLGLPSAPNGFVDEVALGDKDAVFVVRTRNSADDPEAERPATFVSCALTDGRCEQQPVPHREGDTSATALLER